MKTLFKYFGLTLTVLLVVVGVAVALTHPYPIDSEIVDARYTNEESQFALLSDGARVHYRDEGNQQGPAIVLIHGSNMSLHVWEPWVKELAESYRVISMDMPGHGLTGRVPNDDYSADYMAKVVDGVMNHLGVAEFYIGGNSMGGRVSWLYALDHREKVRGLILLDASGYPDDRPPASAFRMAQMPVIRDLTAMPVPRYMMAKGLKDAVEDKSIITESMIDMYTDLGARAGTQQATALRFKLNPVNERYKELSSLETPTLILWGEMDSFVLPKDAKQFDNDLANSQLIIYPGIGHIPNLEIPGQTAKDLTAFIAGIEANSVAQIGM